MTSGVIHRRAGRYVSMRPCGPTRRSGVRRPWPSSPTTKLQNPYADEMKGPIWGCLVNLRTDFEVFHSMRLDAGLRPYLTAGSCRVPTVHRRLSSERSSRIETAQRLRMARLTALKMALSDELVMLGSTPTPQNTLASLSGPISHSTYDAACASPPVLSACSL